MTMENIFRKKSLESLNSPENLDEYLKVTNISGWIVLLAFILILAGVVVWGLTSDFDGLTALKILFG